MTILLVLGAVVVVWAIVARALRPQRDADFVSEHWLQDRIRNRR